MTAITSAMLREFFPAARPVNLLIRGIASSEKLIHFILPYFKTGSALFFFGYASKELCCNAKVDPENQFSARVDQCRQVHLPPISVDFSKNHGFLFIGTGVCSAFEALHEFAIINLGKFYPAIAWGGTSLFLFANMVAMEQNICDYLRASRLPIDTSEDKKQEALQCMKSALLGMMSNLGYITATAFALLGGATAVALVIGCISACFGALKILYDFYCLYLQKNFLKT